MDTIAKKLKTHWGPGAPTEECSQLFEARYVKARNAYMDASVVSMQTASRSCEFMQRSFRSTVFKLRQVVSRQSRVSGGGMAKHFTNNSCPFCHRAMFARALRPVEVETQYVPYGRQVEFAERLGVEAIQGGSQPFKSKTVAEIKAIRQEYLDKINPSGEVPSLCTAEGAIITESEILAEYFDLVSDSPSPKLVPPDPVQASRVRLVMKKFNDVIPGLFGLLRNQDGSKDQDWADKINSSLQKFSAVLSKESDFCVGSRVSLADVHCAPFLHRLSVGLLHFRDFQLLSDPRIEKLLKTVAGLPEFQNGNLPDKDIIANYEFVAHGSRWGGDGKSFRGRGRSKFGQHFGRLDAGVTIHYFPVRGRAEALRMLLRAAGIPYVDKLYSPEEWNEAKKLMPEGKGVPGVSTRPVGNRGLPVLELATGEMVPETADIARLICQEASPGKFPALQGKELDQAHEMAVASNTYPLMFPGCMLASYPEEVTDAILRGEKPDTYHGNLSNLPPYSDVLVSLQRWEACLGDAQFFAGDVPHYGEFMLFNVIDALRLVDPACAAKLGCKLRSWFDRMARLPFIDEYLRERPQPGPTAHGKPGSIITKYADPAQRGCK